MPHIRFKKEGFIMKPILEIAMSAAFDIAMLFLILKSAGSAGGDKALYRFMSATFGIGFLTGIISICLLGGSYTVLTLDALGFMLSYTAFVFTFSGKKKHDERN